MHGEGVVVRSRFGGSPNSIRVFDVKFTKPLVLPAKVGLYLQATEDHSVDRFWLAVAPARLRI